MTPEGFTFRNEKVVNLGMKSVHIEGCYKEGFITLLFQFYNGRSFFIHKIKWAYL